MGFEENKHLFYSRTSPPWARSGIMYFGCLPIGLRRNSRNRGGRFSKYKWFQVPSKAFRLLFSLSYPEKLTFFWRNTTAWDLGRTLLDVSAWVLLAARGACCFLGTVFQLHYRVVNGKMPDLRTWSPSGGSLRYLRYRFITRSSGVHGVTLEIELADRTSQFCLSLSLCFAVCFLEVVNVKAGCVRSFSHACLCDISRRIVAMYIQRRQAVSWFFVARFERCLLFSSWTFREGAVASALSRKKTVYILVTLFRSWKVRRGVFAHGPSRHVKAERAGGFCDI